MSRQGELWAKPALDGPGTVPEASRDIAPRRRPPAGFLVAVRGDFVRELSAAAAVELATRELEQGATGPYVLYDGKLAATALEIGEALDSASRRRELVADVELCRREGIRVERMETRDLEDMCREEVRLLCYEKRYREEEDLRQLEEEKRGRDPR